MALSAEDRATIVANNKSLRNIKNELEFLAERGVVSDEVYDVIISALPAESPLRGGALPSTAAASPSTAAPAPAKAGGLTDAFASMSVSNPSPAPSTNSQPLPPRGHTPVPAPPPARKPELCHAVALYAYNAADAGDLALHFNDHISVTEYMNAEWWSGINVRTGAEGIFPKNYIRVENYPSTLAAPPPQYDEKVSGYGGYPGQPIYGQPQPQNPYNNPVPPMAVANEQDAPTDGHGGKGKEYAKKFGSRLGSAAVFGAGATIGGNIVNSIF